MVNNRDSQPKTAKSSNTLRKPLRAKLGCESLEGRSLLSGFAGSSWQTFQANRMQPNRSADMADVSTHFQGRASRSAAASSHRFGMANASTATNAGSPSATGNTNASANTSVRAARFGARLNKGPATPQTPALSASSSDTNSNPLGATDSSDSTTPSTTTRDTNNPAAMPPLARPEVGLGLAQLVGLDLGPGLGQGPGGPGQQGRQDGSGPGTGTHPGDMNRPGNHGDFGGRPGQGFDRPATDSNATSTPNTPPTLPAEVTNARQTLQDDLNAALPAGFKTPSKATLDALQADRKLVNDGTLSGTEADTKLQADKDAILLSTGLSTDQVTAVNLAAKQLETDLKAVKDGSIAKADADAKIKADKDAILVAAGFSNDQVTAIQAAQDQIESDRPSGIPDPSSTSDSATDREATRQADQDKLLLAIGVSQENIDKIKADTTALQTAETTAFANSAPAKTDSTMASMNTTFGKATPQGFGGGRFGRV